VDENMLGSMTASARLRVEALSAERSLELLPPAGPRVTVVGLGQMGLPVALQFAHSGAVVLGVDTNQKVVDAVNFGSPALLESELGSILRETRDASRIRATSDAMLAVRESEAIIVLVRLTVDDEGQPDFRDLDSATRSIATGLQPGALVVYETTLPVGTTRNRFVPLLENESGMIAGVDFHVCFSPERVQVGTVFRDLASWPKIVGGLTETCLKRGVALYEGHLNAPVLPMSSLEAAEFTKIAENIYRDVNIALANEFAVFADEHGLDLTEIARGANSQPLSQIHRAGIGVGGHCIPVYPWFFIGQASRSRLAKAARVINDSMPAYALSRLRELIGLPEGRKVLILGLAFRGNVREDTLSMAYPLATLLQKAGAEVRVHDPLFTPDEIRARGLAPGDPGEGWADALIVQADHDEYRRLSPETIPGSPALVDGRGCCDLAAWKAAGVPAAGIGR
jgi:UDP-N-acetyl-D-glucosamine dehydrogenase